MRQRRFLPSLNLLAAFDAVIRHGSVTAAAQELDLTQSAVSRLIAALEQQLGKELFTRQRRRLIATPAAILYQRDIAHALDLIQKSSIAVVANPEGGTLSLGILPTFATRWLGPKLSAFLHQNPGIAVNMSTRFKPVDFDAELLDAAIYYGAPPWPGLEHLRLFGERLTACAAPSFLEETPINTPQDAATLPLLYLETRPTAWADWFAGQGVDLQPEPGMIMDQFSMMTQAAISGLGIALLPDYLARTEIDEGRLRPVLSPSVPVQESYWLVWPSEKSGMAPLVSFRHWLAETCAAA